MPGNYPLGSALSTPAIFPRRVRILATALICTAALATSQGLPDPADFSLSEEGVKRDVLHIHSEWGNEKDLATFDTRYSFLTGSMTSPQMTLTKGNQFRLIAGRFREQFREPGFIPVVVDGGRADFAWHKLRFSASAGTTVEDDPLFTSFFSIDPTQHFASLHSDLLLDSFGKLSGGATWLKGDDDRIPRTLIHAGFEPKIDQDIDFRASAGMDLSNVDTDHVRTEIVLGLTHGLVSSSLLHTYQGVEFGPRHRMSGNTGRRDLLFDVVARDLGPVRASTQIRRSRTFVSGSVRTFESREHRLTARSSGGDRLVLSLRESKSSEQEMKRVAQLEVGKGGQGVLDINGFVRHGLGRSAETRGLGTQCSWRFKPFQEIGVRATANQFGDRSRHLGMGVLYSGRLMYQSHLDANADISLTDRDVGWARSGVVGMRLRWDGNARWSMNADQSWSLLRTGKLLSRTTVFASYAVDNQNQLSAEFLRSPSVQSYFSTRRRDYSFYLRWDYSHGGPLQRQLKRRLLSTVKVVLKGHAVGTRDPVELPVLGAQLRLLNESTTFTSRSRAVTPFRALTPGVYTVSVDTLSLGPNRKIRGASSRRIRVKPGERKEVVFDVDLWSSVYAVAWNDTSGGGGDPPAGYVPVSGAPIQIDEMAAVETGGSGTAEFLYLTPGEHHVSIDPARLPPGITSTSENKVRLELQPGEERVVSFGLRGNSTLHALVLVAPGTGEPPQPVEPGTQLLLNDRVIGTTDADGMVTVEVPAGNLLLGVRAGQNMGDTYLESPSPPRVNAVAGQSCEVTLTLHHYAKLAINVVGPEGPLAGIPIEISEHGFKYTDVSGRVELDRLRSGVIEIMLNATYLPAGLVLESSPKTKLVLQSGDQQEVTFRVGVE